MEHKDSKAATDDDEGSDTESEDDDATKIDTTKNTKDDERNAFNKKTKVVVKDGVTM